MKRKQLDREFNIELIREKIRNDVVITNGPKLSGDTICGKIYVNGKYIGEFFENDRLRIPTGQYSGNVRMKSPNGLAQGPLGSLGKKGDFLLEVTGVEPRTDILFHAGTTFNNSKGCILLGAGSYKGQKYVVDAPGPKGPGGPLYNLRKIFYGEEAPDFTPSANFKRIKINIIDNIKRNEKSPVLSNMAWEGTWEFPAIDDMKRLKIPVKLRSIVSNGKIDFYSSVDNVIHDFIVKEAVFTTEGIWNLSCVSLHGKHKFTLSGLDIIVGVGISETFLGKVRQGEILLNRVGSSSRGASDAGIVARPGLMSGSKKIELGPPR